MTQPGRPLLHPVTPRTDVSDEQLAQSAANLGVRTLLKPGAPVPLAAQQIAQDASDNAPRTTPSDPSPKGRSAVKKTTPALSRLSVWIPTDVHVAVNVRAAKEKSSNQFFVLKGLKAIGFEVDDAYLVPDARRVPPKTKRS